MATTVYNFLSPDLTEVEEQRIISAPGATPGDVLTVAANGTVSPAPGGGSLPLDVIVQRVAWDTPGLQVQSYPITGVNQGAQKFTIAGDHVAAMNFANMLIPVTGSTGNDATYSVVSATLVGGNTVIEVNEAIPDATVDGDLAGGGGIAIHTPAVDDLFVLCQYWCPAVPDGTNTTIAIGYADDVEAFAGDALLLDASYDAHLKRGQAQGFITAGSPAIANALRITDTTPIRCRWDAGGNGSGAPGATMGEAILMLILAKAPA